MVYSSRQGGLSERGRGIPIHWGLAVQKQRKKSKPAWHTESPSVNTDVRSRLRDGARPGRTAGAQRNLAREYQRDGRAVSARSMPLSVGGHGRGKLTEPARCWTSQQQAGRSCPPAAHDAAWPLGAGGWGEGGHETSGKSGKHRCRCAASRGNRRQAAGARDPRQTATAGSRIATRRSARLIGAALQFLGREGRCTAAGMEHRWQPPRYWRGLLLCQGGRPHLEVPSI